MYVSAQHLCKRPPTGCATPRSRSRGRVVAVSWSRPPQDADDRAQAYKEQCKLLAAVSLAPPLMMSNLAQPERRVSVEDIRAVLRESLLPRLNRPVARPKCPLTCPAPPVTGTCRCYWLARLPFLPRAWHQRQRTRKFQARRGVYATPAGDLALLDEFLHDYALYDTSPRAAHAPAPAPSSSPHTLPSPRVGVQVLEQPHAHAGHRRGRWCIGADRRSRPPW